MFYVDPLYLIFALPGLILAGYASYLTHSTFKKYENAYSDRGLSGAQAAQIMLSKAGVDGVSIEQVGGFLSDHYDPSRRVLRLSPSVYSSTSLSAIGVACHEAGHAVQHADGFLWLSLRTALVPAVNFSSNFSYIVLILGFLLRSQVAILAGIALFAMAVIFSIVTLPVEWDASNRAKKMMLSAGIVTEREAGGAGKVLNAAFLTYVAAAVSSVMTLLYYLLRSGILGGSDD